MIVIVDYGMGNLRSVEKAFEIKDADVRISSSKNDIHEASKIVLPGVGAFQAAARELEKRDLVNILKKKITAGTPYLGLCLGLQLLFAESEESDDKKSARGLGVLPGRVRKFKGPLKIPHMGWNTLKISQKKCPLFKGVAKTDYFYFVHSYFAAPSDKSAVAASTQYGTEFCSAIWKDNVFATQFHPEKSQGAGLKIIENFIALPS